MTESVAVARAAGDREVEAVALAFLGFVDLDGATRSRPTAMEAAVALHLELGTAAGAGRRQPWTTAPSRRCPLRQPRPGCPARDDVAAAERSGGGRRRNRALGSVRWLQSYRDRVWVTSRARGDQASGRWPARRGPGVPEPAGYKWSASADPGGAGRRRHHPGAAGAGGTPARRGRGAAEEIGAAHAWRRSGARAHLAGGRAHLDEGVRSSLGCGDDAARWSRSSSRHWQRLIPPGLRPRATAPDPAVEAGLTAREAEVLRLLAQGLSDREIAESLSLSPRTVSGHVTHLLTKLDLESRTAAAIFAVRHGLV